MNGAMIYDVAFAPYAHWVSFHYQGFEQAAAWKEDARTPA